MTDQLKKLLIQQENRFKSIDAVASECQDNPPTPARAAYRLQFLGEQWKVCVQLHDQIVGEAEPSDVAELDYFTASDFLTQQRKFMALSEELHELAFPSPPQPQTPPAGHHPEQPAVEARSPFVQVPSIALPRFSGAYSEWKSFYDYFDSLIIKNPSLDDLRRFHFLKSCLDGEASQVIRFLPITAANFAIAWQRLDERFNNPRTLVNLSLDALFSVSSVTQETASELSRLLHAVKEAVETLKGLGRPTDQWSDILVHIVVSKLDKSTRKAWELSLGAAKTYPTFNAIETFLESRIQALESVSSGCVPRANKPSDSSVTSKQRLVQSHAGQLSPSNCPICEKTSHPVYACREFPKIPVEKRLDIVSRQTLCYNCLSPRHSVKQCNSTHHCKHCGKRHHSLLHRDAPLNAGGNKKQSSTPPVDLNSETRPPAEQPAPSQVVTLNTFTARNSALLATAWVRVTGLSQQTAKVRALLDQGSTHTIITRRLSNVLGLSTYEIDTAISGIGGACAGRVSQIAPVVIGAADGNGPTLSTDALILPKITAYVPRCTGHVSQWPHLAGLTFADPEPHSNAPIQILLGADVYGYALREGLRKGDVGQPVAQQTIFGWVLSGSTTSRAEPLVSHVYMHLLDARESLDVLMRRFWEVEEGFGTAPTREDERCEAHFNETHSRTPEGRYIVRLPFKTTGLLPVGDSRLRADRLLLALERRFARDPEMHESYIACLRDYETRGHMTPADEEENGKRYVYLPHHPVIKHSSTTTKLRVVFNASALTTNRRSLNQLQYVGPKLQTDLPLLVARWRAYRYVCSADVEQMYRQIIVHPDDCDFQRIRWRYSPLDPIRSYQLRTVTFGTASAPFLAQRVLKQLADDEGQEFPLAAPLVRHNFYVDDCLVGADDLELARQMIHQLIALLSRGGFTLRKWASNSQELLNEIDPTDHGLAAEHLLQSDQSLKILGIKWCPLRDDFRPTVHTVDISVITRRAVLSAIARLYDPLGWLGAVIIRAKIFMQHLWDLNCDWDDVLGGEERSFWIAYYDALPTLEAISIPRWIGLGPNTAHRELHGFADASTHAYAAVVFLRTRTGSGDIFTSLVCSKTKVAPRKVQTVPRLELCAAALLAKVLAYLRGATEYSNVRQYCWTDSTVVLDWLTRSSNSYDVFVANRVSAVHSLLEDVPWGHVRGTDNPADLGSRGIAPESLANATLWWNGPPWLSLPESEWPNDIPPPPVEAQLELRTVVLFGHGESGSDLAFADRFSSWTRLTRVIALILRWSPRWRRVIGEFGEPVTADEIRNAVNRIVRGLQTEQFSAERTRLQRQEPVKSSSALASLNPFLDRDGLIRVGGRLERAELSDESRYPLVLRVHHITRLLIVHEHERTLHGGISLTLSTLRTRFWILQAKRTIRAVLDRCIRCARVRDHALKQLMGALPAPRVRRPDRPFEHCGVDYAGPVQLRMAGGRGRTSHVAYIALFICLASKAVHLEIVTDCSTPAFIAALHRFCSRRNRPSVMYSDNGRNFHGADREIRQAFVKATSDPELRARLSNDLITWRFIPPAAAHVGGLWEAGIKSVKFHLRRVLANQTPTYEELATLCARIEACLNSRPLAPLHEGTDSLEALTPGHFLVGGPLTAVPMPSVLDTATTRLGRWQALQQRLESFWKSWSNDYVQSLQKRTKWKIRETPLQIGQLVLLRDVNLPPIKWRLGLVTQLHPGDDGLPRVATIRTATSEYVRHVNKLALLPVAFDNEAEGSASHEDEKLIFKRLMKHCYFLRPAKAGGMLR